MKKTTIILPSCLACFGTLLAGCGDSVPENTKSTAGVSHWTSITPEERIQKVKDNPSLSQEEKDRRIQEIKYRNHIKQ